jgi:hypothetical protein
MKKLTNECTQSLTLKFTQNLMQKLLKTEVKM